jgi:hypothetical protein
MSVVVAVSPNQSEIQTVLRAFLLDILPAGTAVVEGQDNRVAEPKGSDFVVFTCIQRPRLATNIDEYVDALFVGSIAAGVMTITGVEYGRLMTNSPVYGVGVTPGTKVTGQLTGAPGGIGTYSVAPPQVITPEYLAAGTGALLQKTEIVFQLDVHGPSSADSAQAISTLFRDDYACEFFAALDPNVAPLFADDPRQMPFSNDQQQVENRWMIEAHIQANQTIVVGQQFADVIDVGVVSVDATYPP